MTRNARRAAARREVPPASQVALRLLRSGDAAGAASAAVAVLARSPDDATARQVLGIVAGQKGDLQSACDHFAHVVALDPRNADAHGNLAEALSRLDRSADSLAVFRRALALAPGSLNARVNCSLALIEQGLYGEAVETAGAALGLDPRCPQALQNLSLAQWGSGHVEEAIATLRRAVELDPGNGPAWSNLLMILQYSAAHSEEDLLTAARAWGRTMDRRRVGPLAREMPEPARLRVGYASGDLRDHPVGHGIERILSGHDPARVEVFLYATNAVEDAVTDRLKRHAKGWRNLAGLDDETAARRIAADSVHVLVDLSGHTAHHRLGVFAHRPAPVQATWLGYFATTGLPQMDYVLRDPAQIPPEEARFYTERVWTLEDAAFGYRPHPDCPDLTPLPAHQKGHVTFGCFANPAKISGGAIAAWARVLHGVPGSRMILDRKGLDDPLGRDRVLSLFSRHGIGPDRLDLGASQGHLAYMARYAEVDVVLDTFPCNGATTTYEALWMGVPVVSRRWRRMVGHFAESILGPCGHGDWVVGDVDGYVAAALALAGDLDRLSSLRASLRGELASSPLCQADDCARCLERAYEGMWREARGPEGEVDLAAYQIEAARAFQGGDAGLAERMFRRATELAPGLAEAHNNLGVVLRLGNRVGEAILRFERALALLPDDASARANLGASLIAYGRTAEAVEHLQRAVALDPGVAQYHYDLTIPLALRGRFAEAFAAFERGAALDPAAVRTQGPVLYDRLGDAFATHSRFEEAVVCFTQSLGLLHGGLPEGTLRARACHAVGTSLQHAGRVDEAMGWFTLALDADPNDAEAHGSLAWCFQYSDRFTEDQAADWAKAQARRYDCGLPIVDCRAPFHNPHLPLRVGYLSPDFRDHPVGHVMETLLQAHDLDGFELFLYGSVVQPDAVTARLANLADRWRDIALLEDDESAELIRQDGLDILIDLAGYTKGHRMGVFARKPAPVQAQWLGYWATSGLGQMDYFIVHPTLIPPEDERLYTERPMRVEGRAFCYAPPKADILVPPLPALARDFVTFGCHNYLAKVTSETIRVWSRVLEAVPGSRMRLNRHAFGSEATREHFLSRFESHGVDRSRIDLLSTSTSDEHLVALGEFDVMLDTFPFNGGTSIYEALWMGLPVVTMAAPRMVGHFGENILEPLGFGDWVARSPEEYVARAVAFAGDLPALSRLRDGLRAHLLDSPLCDAPAYVREIEDAFRRMASAGTRSV